MVVGMSRHICVDLYDEIVKIRPEWHSTDHRQGAIKIVFHSSASDDEKIRPHAYGSAQKRELENRFKDPNDSLKIVIVRDMWLTGYDAPPCHTMYVDKPMKGHGLMQAIARVNRVFRDKPGGLVVDYIGIATELNGKWALVSVAFVANIAATSLRLRIFPSSGTYTNAIAGIAAQNLGAHVNDGSVAAEIYPVRPSFPSTTIPVSRAYGGITLPAQTNAAVIVTVPTSPLDSMVSHSYSQDLAGLIHSSEMRTTTTVRIQLFNPTAGPITIPAGTFYVEVRPKAV
jgi:hypothetical protein